MAEKCPCFHVHCLVIRSVDLDREVRPVSLSHFINEYEFRTEAIVENSTVKALKSRLCRLHYMVSLSCSEDVCFLLKKKKFLRCFSWTPDFRADGFWRS